MLPSLRILLILLGVSAVLIGLSVMLLGPERTAWLAETGFAALSGSTAPLSEAWPPTMDSELRFYAPFWGAYGIILILVGRDLSRHGSWVPWLAGLFFTGGAGRLLSLASTGRPHPFFMMLMAIELALPPLLIGLWLAALRPRRSRSASNR